MTGSSATSPSEGSRFAPVRWVAETGSTNADLLAAAAEGAPEGLVLVADHQSAGRGRLDRSWQAPPGASLLVSVLLRPRVRPEHAFLLTTATGVAAVEACEEVTGWAPGLKWPNDLVAVEDDAAASASGSAGGVRKLGGILAESRLRGGSLDAVVVGMGLNVQWPAELPPELADVAVALNHVVGHPVDRRTLLDAWLARLEHWLTRLEREPLRSGRRDLLDAARSRSATLGRQVQVELPGGRWLEGTAAALTEHGHLVVRPGDGGEPVEVTVGDVVHARLSGP